MAIVAALGMVAVTGADFTDRGQFNYRVAAEGSPSPTTPPATGNGVPSQNFSNRHSLARSKNVLYGWGGGVTTGTGAGSQSLLPVVMPSGTTFTEIAA
ncbi:hypothetical protein, partial [Leifsonia sp. 71-9]